MKIYLDNIPLGEVSQVRLQRGEFFPQLVAVRVSGDGNMEAVYIPRVRFQRRAGQVLIEINSDRPLVYITLQARRPFIHIFRFQWELEETYP